MLAEEIAEQVARRAVHELQPIVARLEAHSIALGRESRDVARRFAATDTHLRAVGEELQALHHGVTGPLADSVMALRQQLQPVRSTLDDFEASVAQAEAQAESVARRTA